MSEQVPSEKQVQAEWNIELTCDCPGCKLHVDLIDYPDFWVDRIVQPCESRKGLAVVCPECGYEFEVDCVY